MKNRFSRFVLVMSIFAAWNVLASEQSLNLKAARELMPVLCEAGKSAFVEKPGKKLSCNAILAQHSQVLLVMENL
jgi:hypothetical protein